MRGPLARLAWIALAIVLIVVGCGPTPTHLLPTQPPAPTATTALPFPISSFVKANITWEFRADGTYSWKESLSETEASGTYTVTGNQIVIKDDYAPCKDVVATYAWAYDGQKLSLTLVDDACRDRRLTFDQTKWTKKP